MYLGALEFDILLGDVHSLKEKRSVIRPILAELQRFGVSTAEAGNTTDTDAPCSGWRWCRPERTI